MYKYLLILIAALYILVEIYQKLRQIWLHQQKKKDKQPRKPAFLRPKSERDCQFCQEGKLK